MTQVRAERDFRSTAANRFRIIFSHMTTQHISPTQRGSERYGPPDAGATPSPCKPRWQAALGLALAAMFCTLTAPVHAQALTEIERQYVSDHIPTLCVDPVWEPFEVIDPAGKHIGIAADLHALVRERLGLRVQLHGVRTWDETLAASKSGLCQMLSFVNRTPERDQWLIFTEPLLTDPNVLITREEQPTITNLAGLIGKKIALPRGTAMSERIKKAFPNLTVVDVVEEEDALALVSNKTVDMTLRSMIVAAHTIKKEGWFNLKLNSQLPGYENHLRIGVLKSEPQLRDILNKGIATLTEQERASIVDRHVQIKMVTDVQIDYTPVKWMAVLITAIVATSLFWLRRLRNTNRLLRTALADVKATEAEQRLFIAMLSHEVRSPMAVIDTTAQLLSIQLDDDDGAHRLVARIRRGVARLSNFFDNCLTQERVNSKNFALHPVDLSVAELAYWAEESAELLSGEHDIRLELAPDLPALRGDQTLLRILLMNLLSNAVKYAPPGTPITLRVQANQTYCRFEVVDQGPGIPEDEQLVIFQRFRRGRKAEGTPGAGLGLAVAARIVALHGGAIALRSPPGEGACFMVDLPFAGVHPNF